MSKKTIIKFVCDVCGNEYDYDTELCTVELPFKQSDSEGRTYYSSYKKFDLCKNCLSRYENAVFNHFAIIRDTLGNIDVEKKESEAE